MTKRVHCIVCVGDMQEPNRSPISKHHPTSCAMTHPAAQTYSFLLHRDLHSACLWQARAACALPGWRHFSQATVSLTQQLLLCSRHLSDCHSTLRIIGQQSLATQTNMALQSTLSVYACCPPIAGCSIAVTTKYLCKPSRSPSRSHLQSVSSL